MDVIPESWLALLVLNLLINPADDVGTDAGGRFFVLLLETIL